MLIDSSEPIPDVRHHQDLRADWGRLSTVHEGPCGSDGPPLVHAADAGREHTVSLDMTFSTVTDSAEPHLRLSWRPQEPIIVRRGVSGDLDRCRWFSAIDGYEAEHQDVSVAAADAIADGSLVDLVVYAVSYGRDRGQHLYSAPLLIGRLRLDDLPYYG